jgi:hypothetical protein
MEITDLEITVTEIQPIGGTFKYAAIVQFLYVRDQHGRRKVHHNFGETWGKSKDEARENMRDKVRDWGSTQ